MPATFPSHAGGVLPLKLLRPTWFDGVALVVGAAVPDLVYVAGCCGPPFTYGHTWWATVVAVPVVLALGGLIRWGAPVVAAHLPPLGVLAVRDYGVLGLVRHRWWVSALSAWLGAASHVLWDHVTHASIAGTGLGLPGLAAELVDGVAWWVPVHLLSTVLGALAWLAVTVHIGRHRLLVAWHGPAPVPPAQPRRFWRTAALVGLGGIVLVGALAALGSVAPIPVLAPPPRPTVLAMRLGVTLALALLTAAASCSTPTPTAPIMNYRS